MAPYLQAMDVADLKRISELICQKYNYHFRNYAMSSFKRRIVRIPEVKKLALAKLISKLTDTSLFLSEFIDELTVNVTSLCPHGYLSIGSKESLVCCDYANGFTVVNKNEKVYRKIKQ